LENEWNLEQKKIQALLKKEIRARRNITGRIKSFIRFLELIREQSEINKHPAVKMGLEFPQKSSPSFWIQHILNLQSSCMGYLPNFQGTNSRNALIRSRLVEPF